MDNGMMPPGGPGGLPMGPGGMSPNGPQMGILKKLSGVKDQPSPAAKGTDLLASAIQSLNDYADHITGVDPGNARAVRIIIKVLGELLKSSQDHTAPVTPAEPTIPGGPPPPMAGPVGQ